MAQSVWYVEDIENILRAMELSCQQLAAQVEDPDVVSFRRGFMAALAATATSFGIRVDTKSLSSAPLSSSGSAAGQVRRLASPAASPSVR